MSRARLGLSLTALLLAVATAAPQAVARPAPPPSEGSRLATMAAGEVLVQYRPGATASERSRARGRVGAALQRRLRMARWELLSLPEGRTVASAVRELRADARVAHAQPNYIYRAASPTDPTDTRYPDQWGLDNIGQAVNAQTSPCSPTLCLEDADVDAPDAWATEIGSDTIKVAVVDTGIAYDHPDLDDNMFVNATEDAGTGGVDDDANGCVDDVFGCNFVGGAADGDVYDQNEHGTHVAGIIGAEGDNAQGITGVAQDVSLIAVRVLDLSGFGETAEVAEGLDWAGDVGADIANASLAGPADASEDAAVVAAIEDNPDTLYVFAAGNETINVDTTDVTPCSLAVSTDNVICVAATRQNDRIASFSNYGKTKVDLGAPGENVVSAVPSFTKLFSDGFERDNFDAKWDEGTEPGNADPFCGGPPASTWNRAAEFDATGDGEFSATESPGALYKNCANSWIQNEDAVDPSATLGACRLGYTIKLDIDEFFDNLWIEFSDDGATWTTLLPWNFNGTFSFEDPLAGLDVDEAPYDFNGASTFYFRFRFETDSVFTDAGVWIDDVYLRCQDATFGSSDYAFFDGTSMSAPHVAGAAALVASEYTGISMTELRNRITCMAEPVDALAGLVRTGGRLNVDRSLEVYADAGCLQGFATDDSNRKITDTNTITLSGYFMELDGVTPFPLGSEVHVQKRPYGSTTWTEIDVAAELTDVAGLFSEALSGSGLPTKLTYYRATTTAVTPGVWSDVVLITVTPKVTMSIVDKTITLGQKFSFSGSINPSSGHGGKKIYIQKRKKGTSTWTTAAIATLTSGGSYTKTWTPTKKGIYEVRARFTGDADHTDANSTTQTVTIS